MLKIASIILVAAALSAPAFAQTAPASGEKAPYACWYNQAGMLSGSQAVTNGRVPHEFVSTGRGGDKAWVYGINSVDGKDCPAQVRK